MVDPNNYGKVVLHDREGDLEKRWYISYSYRNPITRKMERFRIYGHVNRFKTKKERIQRLQSLKRSVEKLLREGYNPLESKSSSGEVSDLNDAITDVLHRKE